MRSSTRSSARIRRSRSATSHRCWRRPACRSTRAAGSACCRTCTAATAFSLQCSSASDSFFRYAAAMKPIDFGQLQEMVLSTRGALELAVTLLCVALAWLIDRRLDRVRLRRGLHEKLPGFVRIAFPLLAVALTYTASFVWRRYVGAPFFLGIAIPELIALAVIRLIAYGLRRLFPAQAWLPASEVAIGTTIWGLAILYFLGVLPEMAAAFDDLVIPIGKKQVSVLTIF